MKVGHQIRVPEKTEQAHIVQLLRSLGGKVYVLGTHRRKTDHPGTMQTPGLPDLIAFLPARPPDSEFPWRRLEVECKAAGGRLRPEQSEYRAMSLAAGIDHVVGNLDAVIAWLADRGYVKASQFPHYRQPKAAQESPAP